MSDMPVPVPRGRWQEYAAAISEGFCPSCRQPASGHVKFSEGVILIRCHGCNCAWEYDVKPVVPVIGWRGLDDRDLSVSWEIWTFEDEQFPSGHPGNLGRITYPPFTSGSA